MTETLACGLAVLSSSINWARIFNGIKIVIVAGRNQADAGCGTAYRGNLLSDFVAGEMTAFAGFRALTDLDLDIIGGIEKGNIDAKAARCDLLPAIARVPAEQVMNFAAFSVHADDIKQVRRLGV